jgi:hypothetical protein
LTQSDQTDLCTVIGVGAALRLTKAREKCLMVSYGKKGIENFSEQESATKRSGPLIQGRSGAISVGDKILCANQSVTTVVDLVSFLLIYYLLFPFHSVFFFLFTSSGVQSRVVGLRVKVVASIGSSL